MPTVSVMLPSKLGGTWCSNKTQISYGFMIGLDRSAGLLRCHMGLLPSCWVGPWAWPGPLRAAFHPQRLMKITLLRFPWAALKASKPVHRGSPACAVTGFADGLPPEASGRQAQSPQGREPQGLDPPGTVHWGLDYNPPLAEWEVHTQPQNTESRLHDFMDCVTSAHTAPQCDSFTSREARRCPIPSAGGTGQH